MRCNAIACLRSGAVTIWLITAMAIGTEVFAPFKTVLTSLLGQHWTSKSVISLVTFAILYTFFCRARRSSAVLSSAILLALSVISGGLVIFGFFIWHFLYV